MVKKIIFKDITFFNFKDHQIQNLFNKKSLFIFPAGPALSHIKVNSEYHLSLKNADHVFFDSGFFVLLLRIFKNIKVNKFSGYKFLKFFFKHISKNKKKSILCVDPDKKNSDINKKLIKKLGVKKVFNYIAPNYVQENYKDKKLLKLVLLKKPDYIVMNIAGGKQEILGFFLKKNLKFKTSIYCTGGAIAFFTGNQAPINKLIDNLFLGWFFRILFNPNIYLLRYLGAFKLFFIVLFSKIKVLKN